MGWMLGAAAIAMVGFELLRVVRAHRAERDGPHLYAGYTTDDPERPLVLLEVGPDDPHQAPPESRWVSGEASRSAVGQARGAVSRSTD